MRKDVNGGVKRSIAVAPQYTFFCEPGDTGVYPDTFYEPDTDSYKMMLDSKGGMGHDPKPLRAGYELELSNGVIRANQRYALVVSFAGRFKPEAVSIGGALLDGNKQVLLFPRRDDINSSIREVSWSFESPDTWQSLLCRVWVEVRYATLTNNSYIRWHSFKVEPKLPDWGNEGLVVFARARVSKYA